MFLCRVCWKVGNSFNGHSVIHVSRPIPNPRSSDCHTSVHQNGTLSDLFRTHKFHPGKNSKKNPGTSNFRISCSIKASSLSFTTLETAPRRTFRTICRAEKKIRLPKNFWEKSCGKAAWWMCPFSEHSTIHDCILELQLFHSRFHGLQGASSKQAQILLSLGLQRFPFWKGKLCLETTGTSD